MKLLLPVDGSESTKRMLAYLAVHDELLRGSHEYHVFTAIEPAAAGEVRAPSTGSLDGAVRERAQEILHPVLGFAKLQGWSVQSDYVAGPAVAAIAEKASSLHPDLIIMGSHGRTALGTLLLGSVANGVLARCKVPVLLIR